MTGYARRATYPPVISSPDFRCLCCKRRSSRASARTRYLQRCLRGTGTDVTHVTCAYPLLAAALDVSRLIRTVRRRHVTAAEPLVTGTFSMGTPDNRRSVRFSGWRPRFPPPCISAATCAGARKLRSLSVTSFPSSSVLGRQSSRLPTGHMPRVRYGRAYGARPCPRHVSAAASIALVDLAVGNTRLY